MNMACPQQRAALGFVLGGTLLASCPPLLALDPSLDVSQYAHKAWRISEGFTRGTITSIAQTPDGYLWLGTEFRLLRFDGVRAVPFQPRAGQSLPGNGVMSLLAARDGTLWIGTTDGLASLKDNELHQYPQLGGQQVWNLLEDREGVVWVGGSGVPTARLCSIHQGNVSCQGEDGRLGHLISSLYEDRTGNLWVGTLTGLWRWRPGPPIFYPVPGEPNGIQPLNEDQDGALLIGGRNGIRRFVDGRIEEFPLPRAVPPFEPQAFLRDRDGGLWVATYDRGLVHVHDGRADVFGPADGFSGGGSSTRGSGVGVGGLGRRS